MTIWLSPTVLGLKQYKVTRTLQLKIRVRTGEHRSDWWIRRTNRERINLELLAALKRTGNLKWSYDYLGNRGGVGRIWARLNELALGNLYLKKNINPWRIKNGK